jgi:hypothetical protein
VDNEKLAKETTAYKPIPVITNFTDEDGKNHLLEETEYKYQRIINEAAQIIVEELERIKKKYESDFLLKHCCE